MLGKEDAIKLKVNAVIQKEADGKAGREATNRHNSER